MRDREGFVDCRRRAARACARLAAVAALAACNDSGAPRDSGVDIDSPFGQGFVAVAARKCGDCHEPLDGGAGLLSGRSTQVPGTQAYPSNLTPDPDTGMDAWDAGSIATALLTGIDDKGNPLCPEMPRYADAGMTADEALAIAAYLRGLPPVWHLVPPSTCFVGGRAPASDSGL